MELAHLEMFVAVADAGSVTAAAKRLLRAPSNVSTRIQQLERELDVKLLVRDNRQVAISADGEVFLDYARRILDLVEEAKTFNVGREPHGLFRLGALESTAAVRIPGLLAKFHLAYPAVQLELRAGSSGYLFDQLVSGQLMAAFSDGMPASPLLTGFPVFEEKLVIISPATVDVASQAFAESPPTVFMFGSSCSYRQRFEDWLTDERIKPNRIIELSSYHSMLACVAAGAGISMMPLALLESLPDAERVVAHEIAGPLGGAQTWLMWRRDCRSDSLKALIRLVKDGKVGPEGPEAGGSEVRPAEWPMLTSAE
jgi:DNA-binding transcriptional LysR family regulator